MDIDEELIDIGEEEEEEEKQQETIQLKQRLVVDFDWYLCVGWEKQCVGKKAKHVLYLVLLSLKKNGMTTR